MKRLKWKSGSGLWTSAILIYLFLYFPMFVVILFSFASNTTQSFPIQGFNRQRLHDANTARLLPSFWEYQVHFLSIATISH
jgi:ABC-type spermidine/putrescine transport system permease subunit II